jgi:hypothetical protein
MDLRLMATHRLNERGFGGHQTSLIIGLLMNEQGTLVPC